MSLMLGMSPPPCPRPVTIQPHKSAIACGPPVQKELFTMLTLTAKSRNDELAGRDGPMDCAEVGALGPPNNAREGGRCTVVPNSLLRLCTEDLMPVDPLILVQCFGDFFLSCYPSQDKLQRGPQTRRTAATARLCEGWHSFDRRMRRES